MGNIDKFRVALIRNIAKQVKPQQRVFKVKPARPLKDIWKETVPDQHCAGLFKDLLTEEALWVTIDEETLGIRPVLFGEMSLQLIDYFNFFQRAKEAVRGGIVTTPVYLRCFKHVTPAYETMPFSPLKSSHQSKHWSRASAGFADWKEQHFRQRVFNALKRERLWLTQDVLNQLQKVISYLENCPIKDSVPGLLDYLRDIHAIYTSIQAAPDNKIWLVAARTDLNISAAMLRDTVALRSVLDICCYSLQSQYLIEDLINLDDIELLYRQAGSRFSLSHGSL